MYKLAFIGGGINSIAGLPHFIASQMDKKFQVTCGVFSTDAERNNKSAEKFDIKNLYSNYKDLLLHEKENIDAVVILTPTPNHIDLILTLLKYNIPIICEKPLVSSLKEIQKIKQVFNPQKHFLVVTNNYSAYPMLRELQGMILNDDLGDILNIRLEMPQESFLNPPKTLNYPQAWRIKDNFIPMISLDLGAHLHHLAHFLLQKEPIELSASYSTFSSHNVVDEIDISFKYAQGTKGQMWMSKVALGHRNGLSIEVYGSKASVTWYQANPEELKVAKKSGDKLSIDRVNSKYIHQNKEYYRMTPGHPSGYIESFANLYGDIATALTNFQNGLSYSNKHIYSLEHAEKSLLFLHTATLSHQNKAWSTIKYDD
jgi:predicted dehydrogenase